VTVIATRELTTSTLLGTIPGLLWCLLILTSWKAMVAHTRAAKRARAENDTFEGMMSRAIYLRDVVTQQGLVDAAAAPADAAASRREFTMAMQELKTLLPQLAPAHNRLEAALTEAEFWNDRLPPRRVAVWVRRSLVTGLTGFAVAVAGARGVRLRDTWMADLAGAPEDGLTMGRWQQVGHAIGFVVAAVRMRSHALAAPLWAPADWLLATESRTRTLTALTVGGQAIYIQKTDGLYTLLTEGWGWCGGCAVALHFLFQWLRRVRGVELAVANDDTGDR
jgi:hypothetical protein